MALDQDIDVGPRLGRYGDAKIGRLVVQAQHWPQPQIPIHSVNIQRRNGDAMGVGQPGPLPSPRPAMQIGLFGKLPPSRSLRCSLWTVEADTGRCAANQGKERRAELSVQ